MKTLIKASLIAALFIFIQMHVSEQLQTRGRQLAFLRNLPHRYLGMLYYSWILQQHRSDYLIHYAAEWNIAVRERECLLEGMTKPVVPILVSNASMLNPHDEKLRNMSKYLVSEELKSR